MKTPHKHAALIKAWADGAEIESSLVTGPTWTLTDDPSWNPAVLYRVKPEPKPNVVKWLAVYENGVIAQGCFNRHDAGNSLVTALLRVEIDHNDPANLVLVSATLEKP